MALICFLLQMYLLVIFARIVLSWFPMSPDGATGTVQGVLHTLTEPLLGPLRSVLPPVQLGGAGLDLSPIVAIMGIVILSRVIC
jgi:YggT family protein